MGQFIFLIWYMVAVLPFLIFLEGFEWFKKFMAKRGYEVTMLHVILTVLIIAVIILYLKGYR